MENWICWLLGIGVGIAVTLVYEIVIAKKAAIGILKINLSNPNADLYKLVIDSDFETLPKKKVVIMKVETDISLK